jgi:hypothetical protein
MNDNKRPEDPLGHGQMSSETSEEFSLRHDAKEKSRQKQYYKEDKNKTAREEHTNGSTPKSRL